jgi:NAD(P)-dependent dehydrogenase (short-subunit alcohol dehydrogenase family)
MIRRGSSSEGVAIVTGGVCGVGLEVARALAGRGFAVVIAYATDQSLAERIVEEILAANGLAIAVRAELTDELDVERLFTETLEAFGHVDVVVDAARRAGPQRAGLLRRHAARYLTAEGQIVDLTEAVDAGDVPTWLRPAL